MTEQKAKREVVENARLCADQGWKATFKLTNGDVVARAYITGVDWEKEAIKVECIGERHLPPRIIFLNEVDFVEVGWA